MHKSEFYVLLLEDDASDVLLFKQRTQSLGQGKINCLNTGSVAEGIQLLQNVKFDIVLADLNLEDSFGIDTIRALIPHTEKRDVPLIVVTGGHDLEIARTCLQLGAQDYLVKDNMPPPEIMLRIIAYACERHTYHIKLKKVQAEYELKEKKIRKLYDHIINSQKDGVLLVDPSCEIVFANQSILNLLHYENEVLEGESISTILDKSKTQSLTKYLFEICTSVDDEIKIRTREGEMIDVWVRGSTVRDENDSIVYFIITIIDITEFNRMKAEKEMAMQQLDHSRKMEQIGTLAAGIAHEINTPAQFISDNLNFLKSNMQHVTDYLMLVKTLCDPIQQPDVLEYEKISTRITHAREKHEIEYILEEMPEAIDQSIEGITRVSSIVRAMKDFSHPGSEEGSYFDLNEAIRSTSVVCRNEWKYIASLEFDLDPELAPVFGYPDLIKQTVLNMIVNAAHAVQDVYGENAEEGLIKITTKQLDSGVCLEINDNGAGIPTENQDKIFTLFFTTKEVGIGTGQGLSFAYSTIKEKHQGTIEVESTLGEGSNFIIFIPSVQQDVENSSQIA